MLKAFIDTDVIISSFISKTGAAWLLLNNTKDIDLYLSNYSLVELRKVADRLKLTVDVSDQLVYKRFTEVKIDEPYEKLQKLYTNYVLNQHDSHIVAGAKQAQALFLVTYNTRDFRMDKIKQDFNILTLTPGMFMQYLRSQK